MNIWVRVTQVKPNVECVIGHTQAWAPNFWGGQVGLDKRIFKIEKRPVKASRPNNLIGIESKTFFILNIIRILTDHSYPKCP